MKSILPVTETSAHLPVPPGGTAAAAWAHDWATTPLGVPSGWPEALKTAASMVLGSNVPMFLGWGQELLLVHNDSYGELIGDRRPVLGRPMREVWADMWHLLGHNPERALAGDTVFAEADPRVMRRNGRDETIWFTYCYNPIRGADGAVLGIFCTITAANMDARSEQRLLESEERFRLIADSAPVPIWVTKLDRTRGFVNRAYVEFLGIPEEDPLTYDWRHLIHPEDAPRVLAESLTGEASLQPFTLEARFHRGDGEWRWLRSISQPRWGPAGEHIGFIGVAHDVTEWKQAEATLRISNEMLERKVEERTGDLSAALDRLQAEVAERERIEEALRQAQKMEAVGRLTGGIAHDFNNLLTPVIGGLEMIVGQLDDPRLKRLAEGALESGRRGAKLTGQLLAFSRIQRISMAPVAVNVVIAKLRQILQSTIGPDIAIETKLDPAAGHARCDENQLENAILNLAINARDAMPEGGTLTIATGLTADEGGPDLDAGDYVCVTVSDTGHGMPPDIAARAIEPFFSTKPFGKGTGLGLAQVYGIASQSGGTVRIESREGRGTAIHILLPFVAEAEAVSGESDEAKQSVAPKEAGGTILLVDDDAAVRDFIGDALAELGHRVETAEDADAALAALDRAVPDLMLVDFAMPGMNGAELARMVRERHPGLPILFITGYAESEQIEAALGPETPVLRKPFGIGALAALIRAHLPARQA